MAVRPSGPQLREHGPLLEKYAASGRYEMACELLAMPMKIRGFGHVKERNRAQVRLRQEHLLTRLSDTQPVKIFEAA